MAQRSLRFGIRDNNHRAATWKLWTETGKGQSEIYLACRSLGGALKASLHQSGKWHIAYSQKTFEELVKGLAKHNDRFIEKWPRPTEIVEGVTLAFRIVTPFSATVSSIKDETHKEVIWIPNAPKPKATEIDILITRPVIIATDWPGKRSMGTSLIGSFPLENGDTVWAINWVVDMPDLSWVADGVFRPYRGKSKRDLSSDSLRAHVFGQEPDGSRVIYDCAVKRK